MNDRKECLFYEKISNKEIRCTLCPQYCYITNGQAGFCNVRYNHEGILYSKNYGIISAYGMDPVEKKPLFDFYPGSKIFSVGSFGCNLKCSFCQNFNISQDWKDGIQTTPENIVDIAVHEKDNIGIAFTYNEPSIWYEFVLETAKLNKARGKKNVLVTNGYINKEPLEQLLLYIDAMNIDLKGFDDTYYEGVCKGRLQPVLDTIRISAKHCHIEITTLLVTNETDNIDTVKSVAQWISSVNPKIPLHLTRYFPRYQYNEPPTDIEFMKKAKQEAEKYLGKVYLGNI